MKFQEAMKALTKLVTELEQDAVGENGHSLAGKYGQLADLLVEEAGAKVALAVMKRLPILLVD